MNFVSSSSKFFHRWLFSTNHKDIVFFCLFFGVLFFAVGTTFCVSDSDLLIQLVNESERGGIKTCWLHSEDVDSYTRYFQMMLDQHYGSEDVEDYKVVVEESAAGYRCSLLIFRGVFSCSRNNFLSI